MCSGECGRFRVHPVVAAIPVDVDEHRRDRRQARPRWAARRRVVRCGDDRAHSRSAAATGRPTCRHDWRSPSPARAGAPSCLRATPTAPETTTAATLVRPHRPTPLHVATVAKRHEEGKAREAERRDWPRHTCENAARAVTQPGRPAHRRPRRRVRRDDCGRARGRLPIRPGCRTSPPLISSASSAIAIRSARSLTTAGGSPTPRDGGSSRFSVAGGAATEIAAADGQIRHVAPRGTTGDWIYEDGAAAQRWWVASTRAPARPLFRPQAEVRRRQRGIRRTKSSASTTCGSSRRRRTANGSSVRRGGRRAPSSGA